MLRPVRAIEEEERSGSVIPFLLSDPESAFWVEAGHVDLFVVARLGGGRRRHLCRIGAGAAIFGMSPGTSAVALLAVGDRDPRVKRLDRARLLAELDTSTESKEIVRAWVETIDRGLTTADPDPEGALFSLERFHARALERIEALVARERAEDVERLIDRTVRDRALFGDTIACLASLSRAPAAAWSTPAGRDPLLEALTRLAEEQRFELSIPPALDRATTPAERIEAIARVSRFRARRVALAGDWWRRDHGPLLAFRGGRAHALIPRSSTRYDVWDSLERRHVRVTRAFAAGFDPSAFTLHRAFPARPLGLRELLAGAVFDAKRDLGFIVLAGMISGAFGLIVPLSTEQIFDRLIPTADRRLLLQLVVAMLAFAAGDRLLELSRSIAKLRAEMRMSAATEAAVWDRVLSLPARFFRRFTTGDLAGRVGAFNAIRQRISNRLLSSTLTAIFASFSFGFLFFIDVELALLTTVLLAFAAIAAALSTWSQLRHQRAIAELDGRVSGLLYQLVRGVSQIRSAAAETRAFTVWARAFSERRGLQQSARIARLPFTLFQLVFPMVSTAVLYGAFATWLGDGSALRLSTGELLAFHASFSMCAGAQLAVVGDFLDAIAIVPAYGRAKVILEAVPELAEEREHPGQLDGELEVNQLSFRYQEDQAPVLEQLSFRARPGELIAVVGASGSGKSTLLRLLLGFEQPLAGAIYYSGQDLSRLDVREVRRQCGVVLQNGKIAPGTIFENVDAARGLSEAQVWEALEMAALAEEVRRMPAQLSTELPLGGGTLSGGQCQRLLIARAIATRPGLLFFDEATSALDTATQSAVTESLERLRATRIVIAHRLSTIKNASTILVLERGRLAQAGTFAELSRAEGPVRPRSW